MQTIRNAAAYLTGRRDISRGLPYDKADPSKLKEEDKIMAHIIRLSTNRAIKDIDDWQAALQAAENPWFPQRTQLYDLYYDLKKDGHLRMIRRQMYKYATGGKFQIMDKDTMEVDKDLTRLFEKQWWKLLRKQWVDQFFEGMRLIQLTEVNPATETVKFDLVDPKHVHPEKGFWTVWQTDLDGIHYRDDPQAMVWLLELGDPYDLGELDPCAPYILFKKNALQSWSEFQERFGIPLAKGKVNASDQKAVNRMVNFLADMGGNSYAVIDHAEDITFEAQSSTDAYDVFDKLIDRCNAEMSKMILLQVMGNDIGKNGSRAQAQTHNIHSDEVKEEMRTDIESLCDEYVLLKLAEHGFKTENRIGRFLRDKSVTKDDNEIDQWLVDEFEFEDEDLVTYIKEKYNVPVKGLRKKPLVPKGAPSGGSGSGDDPADDEQEPITTNKLLKVLNTFLKSDHVKQVKMHGDIQKLYNDHAH